MKKNTKDTHSPEYSIEKNLDSIERKLELLDQKNHDIEQRLNYEMLKNSAETRQYISNHMESIINLQLKHLSHDLDRKISKFVDLIQKTVDPLLKELESRQEDREMHTNDHKDLENRMSDLENRIHKLRVT